MECYLRLMFLKFRHRLGYKSPCAEVADSISWCRFCRIPFGGTVPHPTTLMKLTTRCGGRGGGAERGAVGESGRGQVARTARVRADTPVICANVAYPRDSELLTKAVGKLMRTARRVLVAGGAPATGMTDRRREAARRVRVIASKLRPEKLSREETTQAICRVTGELAGLAQRPRPRPPRCCATAADTVPKALGGRVRGRLAREVPAWWRWVKRSYHAARRKVTVVTASHVRTRPGSPSRMPVKVSSGVASTGHSSSTSSAA